MSAGSKAWVTSGVRSIRWLAAVAMSRRIRSLLPGHSVVTITEGQTQQGCQWGREKQGQFSAASELAVRAPGIFPADGQNPAMMVVTEDPSLLLGVIV